MIALVLLYFAGKAFYDLAARHDKSKWGFAILGVLSYYGGVFFGGIILALIYEFGFSGSIDDINDQVLGLISIPFGVLLCWGFYKRLEAVWSRAPRRFESEEILDAEIPRDDNQRLN